MRHVEIFLSVLWLTLATAGWTAPDAYFTAGATVGRANLEAGGLETTVCGLSDPLGLALDRATGKLYWPDSDSGTLLCAPLTGGAVVTIATELDHPRDVALDPLNGYIYWTTATGIQRMPLGRGGIEDVVVGLDDPVGLALNLETTVVYWTELRSGRIGTMSMVFGGIRTVVGGLASPYGIALDTASGQVYWSEQGPGVLRRMAVKGGGITDVVTGLSMPRHIALDGLRTQGIYWSSPTGICHAPVGGGGFEIEFPGIRFTGLDLTVNTVPDQSEGVWADSAATVPYFGTFESPFSTLRDAVLAVVSGGQVNLKAGAYSEGLTINIPMALHAWSGPVRIGG